MDRGRFSRAHIVPRGCLPPHTALLTRRARETVTRACAHKSRGLYPPTTTEKEPEKKKELLPLILTAAKLAAHSKSGTRSPSFSLIHPPALTERVSTGFRKRWLDPTPRGSCWGMTFEPSRASPSRHATERRRGKEPPGDEPSIIANAATYQPPRHGAESVRDAHSDLLETERRQTDGCL